MKYMLLEALPLPANLLHWLDQWGRQKGPAICIAEETVSGVRERGGQRRRVVEVSRPSWPREWTSCGHLVLSNPVLLCQQHPDTADRAQRINGSTPRACEPAIRWIRVENRVILVLLVTCKTLHAVLEYVY